MSGPELGNRAHCASSIPTKPPIGKIELCVEFKTHSNSLIELAVFLGHGRHLRRYDCFRGDLDQLSPTLVSDQSLIRSNVAPDRPQPRPRVPENFTTPPVSSPCVVTCADLGPHGKIDCLISYRFIHVLRNEFTYRHNGDASSVQLDRFAFEPSTDPRLAPHQVPNSFPGLPSSHCITATFA
jgi:hypothetical protein